MMHLMAAYFEYLKKENKNYIQNHYLPENTILNSMYNNGVEGTKDLDENILIKTYTVPNYYQKGGKINYLNLFK
jgi:hypothetical protein